MGGWRLDRRDALLAAAKQAGKNPGDPQFQLDFFAQELKGRPEFAQFQQAQTPQERQAALMTYFRPAGWTPQAPQNGNGFGNRVQFAQTFAPGQPQVAQGDNVLPSPRPPGAVADGSGTPVPPQMPQRPTEIPRPQPDANMVRELQVQVANQVITPAEAMKRINDDVNRRWEFAQRDASEGRRQADQIAAEDRRAEAQAARVGPEAMLRGAAENYTKTVRPKAENALADIQSIHQIRQLLDAGAFTGVGADAKLWLAKAAEQFNIPFSETANTQVLQGQLANRVLAGMGGSLGAGFSNADRDFVERAKGGQITWTEKSLRDLMRIGEQQARQNIDAHEREKARFSKMPEMARVTSGGFFDLPPVPSYQEWSKANPLPSATPPQQGGQQQPQGQQNAAPPVQGARQAPDGNWYVPDPNRPGKYLMVR
jgi:hypothetical protein